MNTNNQNFQQLEDKTFIIKTTVTLEKIKKEHELTLVSIQKNLEVKGFRKGKAPLNIVESQISLQKLIEEIANNLIPKIYSQEVKKNNLKPIIDPQIKILNPPVTLDKDWLIEITGCELPEIKINKTYLAEIKKDSSKKIEKILEILQKNSQVKLPAILLESDINYRLSQLVDQTKQAGISVTDYLKSKNTTLDQYKQNLSENITKEWTLNLAIGSIAKENNLKIDKKDLDDFLSKNPQLKNNPNMVYFLLEQQKTIAFLQNLK